jgi:ankyrin repeat protein
MAALLLQNGAFVDIESLDCDGMTPLLRAAWNSKEPLAQLFIDCGANVGAQKPQGDNSFRVFSRKGIKSLPLFKRLADEETDINAVDETGCVPILHLAVGGQPQIVAAALERGADIHALNPYDLTPLSHAARLGFKDIVVMLLDGGADIDHNTNNGLNNPLLLAAKNGHVAVLKVLIARGADLDVKNPNGQSALAVALAAKQGPAIALLSTLGAFIQPSMTIHEAVKSGDALNVEMLLSNNPAAIDELDDKQQTPLHNVLVNNGKLAMLELLLRSGANVGAQDVNGVTPLMIAVYNNYGDAVAKILERKPDMSLKTVKKWSAVHYTYRNGSRYIAKLLVAHGAPLDDAEAELGSTPLHFAAACGSLDVARFLLESGANREAKDNNKSTPLLRAIRNNQVAVAEYLLEQGASIFVKSEPYQLSAILHTATWTNSQHLVKLLFDRGAELEDRDNEEITPLIRSAFNLNEAVFHLLLEKGANLESLDIYGRTALQRACLASLEKTVKLLLQAKPVINFKDEKNGMTALHYAAATTNTSTEICQLLLDHGAELDGIDNFGSTPIFKALYHNNMKLLGYLAERGAKLELQDNEGFTVLHRAVREELKPAV